MLNKVLDFYVLPLVFWQVLIHVLKLDSRDKFFILNKNMLFASHHNLCIYSTLIENELTLWEGITDWEIEGNITTTFNFIDT